MKGAHFTTATPVHKIANELLEAICLAMPMRELFYFATSSRVLYASCKKHLELRRQYRIFDLSGILPGPGHAEGFGATLEAIRKNHASVYIEELRFAMTDTIDGEGTQMVDFQGYPTFAGPIQQFSYTIRGILKADSSRILPGSRYFEKWTSLHLEQNLDLVPSFTNLRRIVLPDVKWTVDKKNDSERWMVFIANGKIQPILPHLRTIEWYRAEGTSWSTL